LCKQLIDAVESLKTGTALPGKWQSFRQALRSVWNEQAIDGLMERLERHRSQIDALLIANIRDQLESFTKETESRDARIEQNLAKILAQLGPEKRWQADVVRAAGRQSDEPQITDLVSATLSAGARLERDEILERQTVDSLRFTGMKDRYEQIAEAHKKTFEWVFDDESQSSRPGGRPWHDLNAWLMSEEQMYWVTGKPGAGKSTLMKFLYDDERLMARLRAWNSEIPIYPASFFFWNSGTTMQMSRIGLLRSLLYQTLSEFPHEVRRLFPDRWEHQELFGYHDRPWTWSELSKGFAKMLSDPARAFFFLIDGLDEFDGDCDELAEFLLKTIPNRPNVKVCLASRPWLVFEDAFRMQPSLRMENLTIHDIRLFVLEMLDQSPMYVQLRRFNPADASGLTEAITDMASGVFLWVRLVVKSLLDGLRNGDMVADLHARLLQLPRDLGDLFERMIRDLSPQHLAQASRIFCTVRASRVIWEGRARCLTYGPVVVVACSEDTWYPLTLLSLSFVNEDPHAILSSGGGPISIEERLYRAERTRRHLSSRCRGLVEAPSFAKDGPKAKVQYLHRTVKDFLDEDRARSLLTTPDISAQQQQPFNPHLALAAAFLRLTQAHPPETYDADGPMFFLTMGTSFILQCHCMEQQNNGDYVPFLKEMDRAAEAIIRALYGDEAVANDKKQKWVVSLESYVSLHDSEPLFEYAVSRGLTCYVRDVLEGGFPFAEHPSRDMLCKHVQRYGSVEMAELLAVYSARLPVPVERTGFRKSLQVTVRKFGLGKGGRTLPQRSR